MKNNTTMILAIVVISILVWYFFLKDKKDSKYTNYELDESSFNKGVKNTIAKPTPNYLWRANGGRVMKYVPTLNNWFFGRRYLQKNGQWGTTHQSSSNDLVLGNSDKIIGVQQTYTTSSSTFLMIYKIILGQQLSNGLQQIDFQLNPIGQWNFPNQSVQYTYPIINIGYQPWEEISNQTIN